MADSELEIALRVLADTHGADEVTAALDRVKGQTGDTAAETAKLSDANTDLVSSAGDAGDAVQGLAISGRGLRMVFSQLNQIIPGTGMLLRASMLGAVGAVLAVVVAVGAVIKAFKSFNDHLDEIGKAAAQPLDGGVKTLQTVWDNTKASLIAYMVAYNNAGKDTDTTSTLIKNQQELSDARIAGIKRVMEAEEKLQELKMANAGKSDVEIEAYRAKTTAAIEMLERNKKVEDLETAIFARRAAVAKDESAVAAARKAATEPAKITALQGAELENLRAANKPGAGGDKSQGLVTEDDVNEAKRLRDVAKRLETDYAHATFADTIDAFKHPTLTWAKAEAELTTATENLARQRKLQQQLESGTPIQRAILADELKRAEEKSLKDKTELGDLERQLPVTKRVAAIGAGAQSQAEQVEGFGRVEKAIKEDRSAGAGIDDRKSLEIARAQLRESQKMFNEMAATANGLFAAHKAVGPAMLEALKTLAAENKKLASQIAALAVGSGR